MLYDTEIILYILVQCDTKLFLFLLEIDFHLLRVIDTKIEKLIVFRS